jgi:hypothetical protein
MAGFQRMGKKISRMFFGGMANFSFAGILLWHLSPPKVFG